VPFVLLLVVAVLVWVLLREGREPPPADLSLVLRVSNGAAVLEGLLRSAQRAGVGRVTVVDEGSNDLTPAIAAIWARSHPGVMLCNRLDGLELSPAVLVLDAREPDAAWRAERVLRWLASGVDPGTGRHVIPSS
jgi:hypothetical protein